MIKATDPVTPRTRLQVLDPFIAELHEALGRAAPRGADGEPVCLCVSGRELTVDSWTGARLDPQSPAADRLLAECCRVVTQSVALLSKCAMDLEALEGHGARAGDDGLRSELMLDAAIGSSLVRDVQTVIDELLKGGKVEEAGHLSKFHHQLRNTVYELRKQVTPEYRATVETLADQLSDTALVEELDEAVIGAIDPGEEAARPDEAATEAASAIEAVDPPDPAPEPPPRKHTPPARHRPLPGAPLSPEAATRRKAPAATPAELRQLQEMVDPTSNAGKPSRIALLSVVLIVAALAFLVVGRPSGKSQPRPAATEAAEPAFADVILLVEDSAPNLRLTVNGTAWLQLLDERRIALMRELTGSPTAARYESVLVRDAEGKLLTSWTVPEEQPAPDPRPKADRQAAPPPAESPGDAARRNLERTLAVPGKRSKPKGEAEGEAKGD